MRLEGEMIDGRPVVVLAHGAGADSQSPFMQNVSSELVKRGLAVVLFDFPYMKRRQETGRKSPPDREPKLLEAFADVVHRYQGQHPVVVGGKSMGGRMASRLAAIQADYDVVLRGWFALGYPFHPPGRPERLRIDHLPHISVPGWIVQGERDPFGSKAEPVETWLGNRVGLSWMPDGNHDLMPRRSSGVDAEAEWARWLDTIAERIKVWAS
ncbi:MAG: alpha/beta fold hydrolase [Gammaproteobacteria bacterium]|nr:MAG: alpha/beta fold hydrolase [Gammaproteobacteria bacterium]